MSLQVRADVGLSEDGVYQIEALYLSGPYDAEFSGWLTGSSVWRRRIRSGIQKKWGEEDQGVAGQSGGKSLPPGGKI